MTPPVLVRMRENHINFSMVADDALAWHEVGHCLGVITLRRRVEVTINPTEALGGQIKFNRDGLTPGEDLFIATMGPAAQLAYTNVHSMPAPAPSFVDLWLWQPANGDYRQLLSNWPSMPPLAEEYFRSLVPSLAERLNQSIAISDLLHAQSKRLRDEETLSMGPELMCTDLQDLLQFFAEHLSP